MPFPFTSAMVAFLPCKIVHQLAHVMDKLRLAAAEPKTEVCLTQNLRLAEDTKTFSEVVHLSHRFYSE